MQDPHSPRSELILCVSADAELRHSLSGALEASGLSFLGRGRADEVLDLCREHPPSAIVLDTRAAGWEELLLALRSSAVTMTTPTLAFAADTNCEAALAAGASDCWIGALVPSLFVHRLRLLMAAGASFTTSANSMGSRATQSSLLRAIQRSLQAPRSDRSALAVLCIALDSTRDLDCGQVVALVQTSAASARDSLRSRDVMMQLADFGDGRANARSVRMGCLLEGLSGAESAFQVAQRLQATLESAIGDVGPGLSVSIGVAFHPENGLDAESLQAAAVAAAVRVREQRGGGVGCLSEDLDERMWERSRLLAGLQDALTRDEFIVHYQPRIDLRGGGVVGFEALMRWNHPQLGLIPPVKFIPLAEETGLILPMGEWVLRTACAQARVWHDQGHHGLQMAVNLSSVQFRDSDVPSLVARVLSEVGIPPRTLELELTETVLLQKGESTVSTLRKLRGMGVHLAIDDFGTGYSNLSYIKRFPVDCLKIDQSFIRDLTTNPADSALTTSIILMGKSLNLDVVAEGVETKSQLSFLKVLECDQAQGYLFSKPVPPAEATKYLETQGRSLRVA